ncbi:MAG: polysaccharide deacetylase family protein [Bacteroidetes bacterium]|nr:polysaccharide deacetylase family protein [Bacteroidota bacterium]
MLLIHAIKITSRLEYTLKLVFNELLGIKYTITTNHEDFKSFTGPKFIYATESFDEGLFFAATDLLFETGIRNHELKFFPLDDSVAFFQVDDNRSALPFDPFAASFYLVSRYEEYLPNNRDNHNRFSATESIAYQQHFLNKPLVNIWSKKIAGILSERYPELDFPEKQFHFIPTIDIDSAYAFRMKGLFRTTGAYLRALTRFNIADIIDRTAVLMRRRRDPFDTFDYLTDIHQSNNLHPIYFFLMGDYGRYDKNIPHGHPALQALVKSISARNDVGIHPSYGSNKAPGKLKKEIDRLSEITGKEITKSRQHFLKIVMPDTYNRLIDAGITDDYTLGYASEPGFRAGICDPFNFYDLEKENETTLRVHPFTIMDGTLKDYKNLSPPDALEHIKLLFDEVKKVNGTFISLWHNESLGECCRWIEWRNVYEEMLSYASK